MNRLTDQQLLAAYAERREEAAFAELVDRHIDLIHSAAVRMVRDSRLAEDVTQGAFVALARNATQLKDRPVLSGWLHRTAQNLAANTVRAEVRRRAREEEAAVMNELLSSTRDPSWEEVAPHLDTALAELSEADRDAVLLRYFEKKSAQEIGEVLGVSTEAAQKRLNRAVERLRDLFASRGVAVKVSGMVALICANAVQSAPAVLAATISATATLTGAAATTALPTAAALTATKAITMTALQKTLVAGTIVVLTGAGVYEARQVSRYQQQVQALAQRQAPLTAQIQALQRERDEARSELAFLREQNQRPAGNSAELLRLRGMAGVARRATAEVEQLKAQLAQQAKDNSPSPMVGAMSNAMKQALERRAETRLTRMKTALQLSEEQAQKVGEILRGQAEAMSVGMQQAMTGKIDKDELNRVRHNAGDADARIKELLTSDQLTAFASLKKEETEQDASTAANQEVLQMQTTLGLAPDQLDGVYAALYQVTVDQLTGANPQQKVETEADAMKAALDRKAAALQPLLTETQMGTYRQEQAAQLKLLNDIMDKLQAAKTTK